MSGERGVWRPVDVQGQKARLHCLRALVDGHGADASVCRLLIEALAERRVALIAATLDHRTNPAMTRFPSSVCIARLAVIDGAPSVDAWSLNGKGWLLLPISAIERIAVRDDRYEAFLSEERLEALANPVESRAMDAYIGQGTTR